MSKVRIFNIQSSQIEFSDAFSILICDRLTCSHVKRTANGIVDCFLPGSRRSRRFVPLGSEKVIHLSAGGVIGESAAAEFGFHQLCKKRCPLQPAEDGVAKAFVGTSLLRRDIGELQPFTLLSYVSTFPGQLLTK